MQKFQNRRSLALAIIACSTTLLWSTARAEDWKGTPRERSWTAGVVTGLAVVDGIYGWGLQGQASRKIVNKGFAEDINNQVWIELGLGPVVVSGGSGWNYTIHLRWEFHRDETYTFFAIGGLAGTVVGANGRLFPRFGIGGFYHVVDNLAIRAEIGHEQLVAGVTFSF
jgi:hypothetical protein